jgi:hypothetical protein
MRFEGARLGGGDLAVVEAERNSEDVAGWIVSFIGTFRKAAE